MGYIRTTVLIGLSAAFGMLAACNPSSENPDLKAELRASLFESGETIWCGHEEYRSCTSTSTEQCRGQQSHLKEWCLDYADESVNLIQSSDGVGEYMIEFLKCTSSLHNEVISGGSESEEMRLCIQDVELDQDILRRAMTNSVSD